MTGALARRRGGGGGRAGNGKLERLAPLLWALALAPAGALAVYAGHRTHPLLPLGLLLGSGFVLLAYLRPRISLLVGFLLVPFEIFTLPLGALTLSASEAVFLLTAVVWAASRILTGHRPWPSSPFAFALALLWLSALPGFLVAEDPAAVIRFLVFWGAFLLLFALVATEGDEGYVRTLLFVLALAGAIAGAVSITGSSGVEQQIVGDRVTGRAEGAFGDPNILATFLAMTLPAAVLVAFEGRWRGGIALSAVALILGGLGFSLSRGGILAAAGAMLVLLAWAPVRRAALAGVAVLIVVTLANANPLGNVQQVQLVLDRVESVRSQPTSSDADQRQLIYNETPRMIADHWLTGVGALNYPRIAPRYGIVDPNSGTTFLHAHNAPLTIAAEQGLLGIAALIVLLVILLKRMRRACSRAAGARRGLGLAVTAAVVALGLQGLVDFTLRSNVIAALSFVLLGALAVLTRDAAAAGSPSAPAGPPQRRTAGRTARPA